MAEVIVAVFDTVATADAAERELQDRGIAAANIRRYRPGEEGAAHTEPAVAAPHRSETHHGGFFAWLLGSEGSTSDYDDERTFYQEHITAGRSIVSIHIMDHQVTAEVMRILQRHAPAELDAQLNRPAAPASGLEAMDRATEPAATTATGGPAPLADRSTEGTRAATEIPPQPVDHSASAASEAVSGRDEVIPLAQEDLAVGKREVDRDTTRVRRYVVTEPAAATVRLRDETAEVERRPASRPVEADAFQDKTVEVHSTTEEPVVDKTAHVGEEVVVRRDGTERTETVRDTVRREQVDVEKGSEPTYPAASTPASTTEPPIPNQRTR